MPQQRPPSITPDVSRPRRSRLLMMPGGKDAEGFAALADRHADESNELLGALEAAIARLALAHRFAAPEAQARSMDDEAFTWVQQSLEDVTATLRGLSLRRTAETPRADVMPVRSVSGSA